VPRHDDVGTLLAPEQWKRCRVVFVAVYDSEPDPRPVDHLGRPESLANRLVIVVARDGDDVTSPVPVISRLGEKRVQHRLGREVAGVNDTFGRPDCFERPSLQPMAVCPVRVGNDRDHGQVWAPRGKTVTVTAGPVVLRRDHDRAAFPERD